MLVMYPNGFLARSDTVEEGCIIVAEPPTIERENFVEDQTFAVLEAMNIDQDKENGRS